LSSKQYSIHLILNNSTEEAYIRRKERVTKKGLLASHKEAISISKPIPNNNRLQIASQIDFPKVRTFLESVARGSKNSKSSYEIGLKHFQGFLNSNNIRNSWRGCWRKWQQRAWEKRKRKKKSAENSYCNLRCSE
jgi:hypothetical protein